MKQNRATLFGLPNSSEAYELRDFLKRSGFPFEWIDLKTDDDARRLARVTGLNDPRLPVCVMEKGSVLFAGYILTGDDLIDEPLPPSYWDSCSRKPMFMETSMPGLFAAGDVRRNSVKRCATAVGDGATAVSMVHRFLELKSRLKSLPLGPRTRSRRLDLGNDVLPADEIDEAQSTRLSEGDSSATDA